jgi:predicted nucleotidyltransferase
MEKISITKIKELLAPIFQRSKVKKAFLFGSYASGKETRKSDLDLMIIMETSKRFFERYDQFDEIYDTFKGCAVELLIYTPEELDKISHRHFIHDILHKGKIIYEC